MPEIGAGGVVITSARFSNRFKREFKKLEKPMQALAEQKLRELKANPMPPGLRFEKLSGYRNPNIYTIHVTGNYKISLEIEGTLAKLRRVACHDEIDRAP